MFTLEHVFSSKSCVVTRTVTVTFTTLLKTTFPWRPLGGPGHQWQLLNVSSDEHIPAVADRVPDNMNNVIPWQQQQFQDSFTMPLITKMEIRALPLNTTES